MTPRTRFLPGTAPILSILLVSLATACATQAPPARGTAASAISPKLSPLIYFEDGNLAFIGVDVRPAQNVAERKIFPLGIGLANRSKGSLTFDRESFVLEDASGKKYPLAPYAEYAEYDRSATDRQLTQLLFESMRVRFAQFTPEPLPFYPAKGAGTVREQLELARTAWSAGNVYFPLPDGGIKGKPFSLLVKVKESPETYVVRFQVP